MRPWRTRDDASAASAAPQDLGSSVLVARGGRATARRLVRTAALSVLLLATAALARDGQDAPKSQTGLEAVLVVPAQRRAIDRALAWLAHHQQPGGMWGTESGTRVADTALATLALMGGGSTVSSGVPLDTGGTGPEKLRGPYAANVRDGIQYLARLAWADDRSRPAGYIRDDRGSRMHGHGFATLALAEAVGNLGPVDMTKVRQRIREGRFSELAFPDRVRYALERAVRLIESAQDPDTGGWYYEPTPDGHEGSMTVTQIAALRAAMDAGVSVRSDVAQHAYDYIRKSQNKVNPQHYGGFAYQTTRMDRVSYGLTAAALSTFFGLGKYGDDKGDREVIRLGLEYLDRNLAEVLEPRSQWWYYNLFYGAQALYLSADDRRIREQWPKIRAALLSQQRPDGSFPVTTNTEGGEEYSTAIAALTLLVPMETLPIFQRR